jgi:excisionase family DNA binding protein
MEATNFLSPIEAAAYLNCTVSKIRKDIHNKVFAVLRIGRLVRIRKDILDQWIEANTEMPRSGAEDEKKTA